MYPIMTIGGKLYHTWASEQKPKRRLTAGSAMYREIDIRFWLEKGDAALGSSPLETHPEPDPTPTLVS